MVTKYGDDPDFTSDGKYRVIGTRPFATMVSTNRKSDLRGR